MPAGGPFATLAQGRQEIQAREMRGLAAEYCSSVPRHWVPIFQAQYHRQVFSGASKNEWTWLDVRWAVDCPRRGGIQIQADQNRIRLNILGRNCSANPAHTTIPSLDAQRALASKLRMGFAL